MVARAAPCVSVLSAHTRLDRGAILADGAARGGPVEEPDELDEVDPGEHLAVGALFVGLSSFLRPGGVLYCMLREPHLPTGAEIYWWMESLTVLGSTADTKRPFPYPAVTNREVERLVPGGNVKTFLTRTGRREVLGIK